MRNRSNKGSREERLTWKTEKRNVNNLVPYEKNPRRLTDSQKKDLLASIKKFDLVEIPAVNRDGTIIAGHQRLKLLSELGRGTELIDVRVPSRQLTEAEVGEYCLRSNVNTGEWDLELLEENFDKNDLINWGFSSEDLSFFDKPAETVGDDDVPELSEKVKTSKGDLYELNEHLLLCGDSTIKSDLDHLADGSIIKMLFTSPPYNMKASLYANYKDNRHLKDYVLFNFNVLINWKRHLAKNGFVFWNMSYNKNSGASFLEIFHQFVTSSGLVFLEDIAWDKGHGMPLSDQLTRQYEHLLVLNESLEDIHFIDHVGVFGTKRIPFIKSRKKGISNYWRVDTFKSQSKNLKAAFPVELPLKSIEICTEEGDTVADCFGGSGSTLIACEKAKRKCLLMEIDPSYCDQIVSRFVLFCKMNELPCSIKRNGTEIEWS